MKDYIACSRRNFKKSFICFHHIDFYVTALHFYLYELDDHFDLKLDFILIALSAQFAELPFIFVFLKLC
jgi:hypothetical protein